MTNLSELAKDPEFVARWPYCWNKIEPFLLLLQRDYAKDHKGKHEDIGRFVGFVEEVISSFEVLTVAVDKQTAPAHKHKKLHNTTV